MQELRRSNVVPLVIILLSIIGVFIVSRSLVYLILIQKALPEYLFVNFGFFRLHHFVYGNVLIVVTSFMAIGLGIRKHKNLFALFYGIGLGLVLDEFLLWMGDTNQLSKIVLFIPHSLTVISVVSLTIASIIMVRLYGLGLLNKYSNIKRSKKRHANK